VVVEALNEKLNVLINMLPDPAGQRLDDQAWRDGNVSAAGIAFMNEERSPRHPPYARDACAELLLR
jgi:hypothetical protein